MPIASPAAIATSPRSPPPPPAACANAGACASMTAANTTTAAIHRFSMVLALLSVNVSDRFATPLCPPRHTSAAARSNAPNVSHREIVRRVFVMLCQCQGQIDDAQDREHEGLDQGHKRTQRVKDHGYAELRPI